RHEQRAPPRRARANPKAATMRAGNRATAASRDEGAKMAKSKPSEEDLDELRETFDYNDRDGDGLIELEEFAALLDELEAGMSEAETRVGFDEIDTNDDDRIDFGEFVAWWTED